MRPSGPTTFDVTMDVPMPELDDVLRGELGSLAVVDVHAAVLRGRLLIDEDQWQVPSFQPRQR